MTKFIIEKYYNKIVKYIKYKINQKISIDILVQNKSFHKPKF